MLNPSNFREYDIRGIADTELLDGDVESLGRALGTYILRSSGRTICVARDCRLSSPRLRDALVRGLVAAGANVLDAGIVPTPLLYYGATHFQADGGIMITGSHNPPEYNGFKTVCAQSTIYGPAIQQLYKMIQGSDYETGQGSVKTIDAVTPYVEEISAQFDWKRRVRVVVDAGNGTAGPVAHRVFEKLNLDVTELYFKMDGNFPHHHPDPTVLSNLDDLKRAVQTNKAELGIAFDGDGDRIGAIDETGNVIFGDMLLLVFGREVLSRKPGSTFIGEVKCSQFMYDKLRELGGNPIMYKTGHSLIKAKMKQEHAELAGEMSGHMFFADQYYGYDDAIYAACRLLDIVSKSGHPLSYQLEGFPNLVSTPELRIDTPDDVKFDIVAKAGEILRKRHQVIDVDGVRVPFEHGWGLVRASNTQPVIVLRFEATTPELLTKYQDEIEGAIEEAKAQLVALREVEA